MADAAPNYRSRTADGSAGPTTVALVGVGGYGQIYLDALLEAPDANGVRLVAGVDPRPHLSTRYDDLVARSVPIFAGLDAMYDAGLRPDLVILATPLHLHAEQAEKAMLAGSDVLCEKPMAATEQDAARMIDARDRSGRLLSIGFQWAFDPGVRRLKADVMACRYGRPLRMRTKVYWPRDRAYYARNGWAGRLRAADGRPVLDSPVNNACAHFIHAMLYLVGEACYAADWPTSVNAELYRANAIENYDTAVIRGRTRRGVRLFAALSHATERNLEPVLDYDFEHGRVYSDASTGHRLIGVDAHGHRTDYGPQPTGYDVEKLWSTIASMHNGRTPASPAEAAAAHTALTAAVQRSAVVTPFGEGHVAQVEGRSAVFVPGLDAVLDRCYADERMPSELGVPWAKAGREVRVEMPGRTDAVADAALV